MSVNNCTYNRLAKMVAYSALISLLLLSPSFAAHERCNLCHLNQSPDERHAELAGSLPNLCITCHDERVGGSEHTINISPMGSTGSLPLVNGRLGCTTCHDPHGTTTMSLRITGDKLCMACHLY